MVNKRLMKIGILMSFGLFLLTVGLYVYWTTYLEKEGLPPSYSSISSLETRDVLATHVYIGVLILSGLVMTILGGLVAFRVKPHWWKIACILLFVSLFLPWWQWSYVPRRLSIDPIPILGSRQSQRFSAHNFLFGFIATASHFHYYIRNLELIQLTQFAWDARFISYFSLVSATHSSPFENVMTSRSWVNTLIIQVLCYVVFALFLFASVFGWSGEKKRRLVAIGIGWAGIVLFLVWLSLAWFAFDLDGWLCSYCGNPCFIIVSNYGYSFLSFGFFAAVLGVVILTVSVFIRDVEKNLPNSCISSKRSYWREHLIEAAATIVAAIVTPLIGLNAVCILSSLSGNSFIPVDIYVDGTKIDPIGLNGTPQAMQLGLGEYLQLSLPFLIPIITAVVEGARYYRWRKSILE